jgi:hypothetical protein
VGKWHLTPGEETDLSSWKELAKIADAVKILTIQGAPGKIAVVTSGQPQGINDARGE